MAFNLRNRSFLKEIDFEPRELRYLLQLSEALKIAKYAGTEGKRLEGKEIALIFEKTSTRTRSAFEVASYDEGAHVTYLDPSGSQMGHKESTADTARVLGRMYDAIEFRGNKQSEVEELAEYAGTYASDEAEVEIRALVEGGKLRLKRRPDSSVELAPTYQDGFTGQGYGTIVFRRDASGRVTGLSVSQDRVWDLRFVRK